VFVGFQALAWWLRDFDIQPVSVAVACSAIGPPEYSIPNVGSVRGAIGAGLVLRHSALREGGFRSVRRVVMLPSSDPPGCIDSGGPGS